MVETGTVQEHRIGYTESCVARPPFCYSSAFVEAEPYQNGDRATQDKIRYIDRYTVCYHGNAMYQSRVPFGL